MKVDRCSVARFLAFSLYRGFALEKEKPPSNIYINLSSAKAKGAQDTPP